MPKSIDQLVSQLIEDRAKILTGDILGLSAVGSGHRKTLENLILSESANVNKILGLQKLAKSNAKLLEAAIRGMRDARTSGLPTSRKTQGLSTYSNSGNFKELAPRTRNIEKRA